MHSSIAVTDGVYGVLTDSDLQARIANLTKEKSADDELSALREQVRRIAEKLGI